MAKYKKKPVIIEAFQFTYTKDIETVIEEAPIWFSKACTNDQTVFKAEDGHYAIKTLEGDHYISDGDYIIQGVNGELYPCKPDIFEKTYESVD